MYIVPQWIYDQRVADGANVDDLMPIGSWMWDKNDLDPVHLTARLRERWGGPSFMQRRARRMSR